MKKTRASAPERILLLDALRGFVLLGVLIVHANHFAVSVSSPSLDASVLINNALDVWVDRLVRIFVEEKAQSVFAAVFGISFIILYERLEIRFSDPGNVHCRRMVGLLIIGLLHQLILPASDILVYFALSGFVLLGVRQWGTWPIAGLAMLLALTVMPTSTLMGYIHPIAPEPDTLGNLRFPALYQYGSYLEIMHRYWPTVWFVDHPLRQLFTFALYVLGRSMLGIVIIRSGVLTEPTLHRRVLKRAAVIGLPVGTILSESLWIAHVVERMGYMSSQTYWLALIQYLRQAGTLLLAAGYVALFTLAWQKASWRRFLSAFVPMGKMAATNYLLQSVFIALIFYGFGLGLLGRLGSTWCALLTFGFFSLQCILSQLWLRRFEFGPVEWLWRSWTYKRFPAWRRVQPRSN